MLLNCGVCEDSWQSHGLQGDPTSPSWRRSVLDVHWKDWCWGWSSNPLATWWEEPARWKRPWWETDRGWDGWMASSVQWTWTWADSRRWWGTGGLAFCNPCSCKGRNTTWRLNSSPILRCALPSLGHVWLFATPWPVAHQAPLFMGILQARIRQWLAMPSCLGSSKPRDQTQVCSIADRVLTIWATGRTKNTPGSLPHPGTELGSPALQADSWPTELPRKPDLREFNLRR